MEGKLRSGEDRGWARELGKPGTTLPQPAPVAPRYRATIRATEPYNAERERAQIARAVHKRLLTGGEDFYTAAKPLGLAGDVKSLAAAEPYRARICDVVPERSVPRRWLADKPQFKTAFPESKEFDFYGALALSDLFGWAFALFLCPSPHPPVLLRLGPGLSS